MLKTINTKATTSSEGLPFLKTKERISLLLDHYLKESKKGNDKVLDQKTPEVIAADLQLLTVFKNGFDNLENLEEFVKIYLTHTNHLSNPKYMGHQVAVPQDLSGIPDWIHGTINNPSSLYEMGPAGAALEGFMINWMLSKLNWFKGNDLCDFSNYPKNGSGVLTHGGSIANLTALSAARAAITPEAWSEGNPSDLVVIGPATAHYSVVRALSIMGMGKKAFVPVPVDSNEVILTTHLERVYNEVKSQNKRVMAVVANACATSSGLFDPMEEMAAFCKKHNLWFHVDGAHGAVALLSEKEKEKVAGIEKADSIIWDAHKMLQVPALCTAVLFKNQEHQWNNFRQKGSYVFHENEVIGMDSMPFTVECTKSALGTKLFWSFALKGEQAMTDFIETSFQKAHDLYEYLNPLKDFHCPYPPQSNILCFQFRPDQLSDQNQLALRYELINSGEFYITSCEFQGKRFLRTVLMNPDTSHKDFVKLAEAITQIGTQIQFDKD
ncbi:aminotransferase class I/II-fold pyridoxal phosphate-dependent enzyme [Flavobacteriaceae bacterium]|nr:aminotransferase class I/II-fold pyridoxal phosphate-dependent enzyme [Flavobacteriaceae bacterium]